MRAERVCEREGGTDGDGRRTRQAEQNADADRRERAARPDEPEREEKQQEEQRFGVRGREEEGHGVEEKKGERTARALGLRGARDTPRRREGARR